MPDDIPEAPVYTDEDRAADENRDAWMDPP
jgi:hypothetical protein